MASATTGLDWKLLRTLATLRITGDKLDRDVAESPHSQHLYLFDTNVVRLFCDPYDDKNLLSLFSQRTPRDSHSSDPMSEYENQLLFAFALQETNSIPNHFSNLTTHVLSPHRRELTHFLLNIKEGIATSSRKPLDPKHATAFRASVRQLEGLVQKNAEPSRIVNYLQTIFKNEMVTKVDELKRLKLLFSKSLKNDPKIAADEHKIEIDADVWTYFNERIFELRQASISEGHRSELTFNIGRDSEAIALICGLARMGYNPIFITADHTLHEIVDSIYFGLDVNVPDRVRAALPTRNFVRHPITYTSLISEYVADRRVFSANKFLKDIDFAFLPVVSNETDQTLARFAYKPATANIQYAPKFREARVERWLFHSFEKIRDRLLFVHERDAAELAYAFLNEVKVGTFDQVMHRAVQGAFDKWSTSSVADLEDTLSAIGILGVSSATVTNRTAAEDEPKAVEVILEEWNDGKPGKPPYDRRPHALDRRLPGFVRLGPDEVDYLHSLKNEQTLGFELNENTMTAPAGVYLVNALITGLQNEWNVSERFAVHCYQRATEYERGLRREGYYWAALAKRHQSHPGGQRLIEAQSELERGLPYCDNEEDKLRFKSENVALSLSISYHAYFYSSTNEYDHMDLDLDHFLHELGGIELEFRRVVHWPYDAIQSRLATQIYSNLTLLALFGMGLPPAPRKSRWYQQHRRRFVEYFRLFEDVIERRGRISLYTRFLFAASQYLRDTGPARQKDLIRKIKEIQAEGEHSGTLGNYDLKKISDFLELCGARD